MPTEDYDADATELLETYGMFPDLIMPIKCLRRCTDFLLKFIIIGQDKGHLGSRQLY